MFSCVRQRPQAQLASLLSLAKHFGQCHTPAPQSNLFKPHPKPRKREALSCRTCTLFLPRACLDACDKSPARCTTHAEPCLRATLKVKAQLSHGSGTYSGRDTSHTSAASLPPNAPALRTTPHDCAYVSGTPPIRGAPRTRGEAFTARSARWSVHITQARNEVCARGRAGRSGGLFRRTKEKTFLLKPFET